VSTCANCGREIRAAVVREQEPWRRVAPGGKVFEMCDACASLIVRFAFKRKTDRMRDRSNDPDDINFIGGLT